MHQETPHLLVFFVDQFHDAKLQVGPINPLLYRYSICKISFPESKIGQILIETEKNGLKKFLRKKIRF